MKTYCKMLAVLLVSFVSVAEAGTVYSEGYGDTVELASDRASTVWHNTYPGGSYWGISRCLNPNGASQPVGNGPRWVCVAYGDYVAPLVVTTTGRSYMPADSCAKAINSWTALYGANGTLTGTSIIEVYGNGANSRPTEFICTASGTIPR